MQLKKYKKRISWMATLLLLQRAPIMPIAKNVLIALGSVIEKTWTWRVALPTISSVGTWHALSGATTYVTSSSSNPSSVTEGESFSFGFYNQGYKAFSYKVEDLPAGLTYNENINGPVISGTLPTAGTYTIKITGYRYSGLSGNQTPVYNLVLNVADAVEEETSTENSSSESSSSSANQSEQASSSLWEDSNTTSLGNGWYRSSWFGDFFGNSGGWTYHLFHGWLYLHGTDESSLWMYDETLGWLYSGKSNFPKIYRNSNSSWLYDQSDATARKFWDYSSSSNLTPDKN
jgi:hypothetical protein